MKILKRILLVIAVVIAVGLIAALFVKKDYIVQRDIVINKPKAAVFDYVKLMRNQEQYSKWVMADPAMKKGFSGTDGTVGFVYTWDSDKGSGKGAQEIKSLVEDERVDMELRFEKPFKNTANAFITTGTVSPEATKVTWGMQGRTTYPMNLMNLFIDKILGGDLEVSLHNLKANLEK